jgi:hypothetical protein
VWHSEHQAAKKTNVLRLSLYTCTYA